MANPTFSELALAVSANAKILDDHISNNDLPRPSFAADGPAYFPGMETNRSVREARRRLIEAAKDIYDLAVGPSESLRWTAFWADLDALSLQAIYHYKIAHIVPLDSEMLFADIAKTANVDQDHITRLLRHAMTNRIFYEPRAGYVAHTAASRELATDQGLQDWIGTVIEEWHPASEKVVRAMEKWPGSQEPDETGFALSDLGQQSSLYHFYENNEKSAQRFGTALDSLTAGEGYDVKYVVEGYSWDKIKPGGTVVDVGGSIGFVAIALARKFPHLNCIVQDLAPTVAKGEAALPTELEDRVTFMSHDFFTPQPVKGADVYFFRFVMHNWSDKYVLKILKALVPAMKHGSRVVVSDYYLPGPGTLSRWDEKEMRSMDLRTFALLNAKERTAAEIAALFRKADQRLKFIGSTNPQGCRLWMVEARFEDEM